MAREISIPGVGIYEEDEEIEVSLPGGGIFEETVATAPPAGGPTTGSLSLMGVGT